MDLNDIQWLQACLSVRHGGLGIRSAAMLAPSAFLASVASTHDLQQSILWEPTRSKDGDSVSTAETRWMSLSGNLTSATESIHVQRAWDSLLCKNCEQLVCSMPPQKSTRRYSWLRYHHTHHTSRTNYHVCGSTTVRWNPPLHLTASKVMMIVWRLRGNIIRTVLYIANVLPL